MYMKRIYKGITVSKCIEDACKDLNKDRDELKFKIIDNDKKFFKKKCIEVEVNDDVSKEEGSIAYKPESVKKIKSEPNLNPNDGSAGVIEGRIIVHDPKDGGTPAYIIVTNNVKITVDGSEVTGKVPVYEKNDIKVQIKRKEAFRKLDISMSKNNMKAYGSIIYKPQIIYRLKDSDCLNTLNPDIEIKSKIEPPKYTLTEIKQELAKQNINYGIIHENLKKLADGESNNCLLAEGIYKVDPVDDYIEIKFKTANFNKKLEEDKLGNIDFKSIGSVEAVKKGDIIAVKHDGKDGKDGKDITGKLIKSKNRKVSKLIVKTGCYIKDNAVISAIDGKPCVTGKVFCVYQLHEVRSDVDLKTGNIKFIGDINIYGSVKEGMSVDCGNSLLIEKDVDRANINAKGNIDIKGNVIASRIFSGGEDVNRIKCINDLTGLGELLESLASAANEINKYDLLGKNVNYGQVVKILIENKFRKIPRICLSIITNLKLNEGCLEIDDLMEILKSKLIGISPISIKNFDELNTIIDCINEKTKLMRESLSIPVNISISYCQDSNINSSGDIVIVGRGEYISNIDANGTIEFMQDRSIARGGTLKAKREIRCRIVGSLAGVTTKLQVDKQGNIWADEAYQNTMFIVGTKEYMLDTPSKNVHVYLDRKGDMQVEKFVL